MALRIDSARDADEAPRRERRARLNEAEPGPVDHEPAHDDAALRRPKLADETAQLVAGGLPEAVDARGDVAVRGGVDDGMHLGQVPGGERGAAARRQVASEHGPRADHHPLPQHDDEVARRFVGVDRADDRADDVDRRGRCRCDGADGHDLRALHFDLHAECEGAAGEGLTIVVGDRGMAIFIADAVHRDRAEPADRAD